MRGPAAERPRVELRGLALYALWPPEVTPPAVASAALEIWAGAEPAGLWRSTHLAWQPDRPGVPTPWLTPEQAAAGLVKLRAHLDAATAAQGAAAQGAAAQGAAAQGRRRRARGQAGCQRGLSGVR